MHDLFYRATMLLGDVVLCLWWKRLQTIGWWAVLKFAEANEM
jgi:hypothetical protein